MSWECICQTLFNSLNAVNGVLQGTQNLNRAQSFSHSGGIDHQAADFGLNGSSTSTSSPMSDMNSFFAVLVVALVLMLTQTFLRRGSGEKPSNGFFRDFLGGNRRPPSLQ